MIADLPARVDYIAATIALPLLLLALGPACYRVLFGPTAADRVLGLDTISILTAGILGVYAIRVDKVVYVDVAIVVILVTFLATIGFARHISQSARAERANDDSRG